MTGASEIVVLSPDYCLDRAPQLAHLLRAAADRGAAAPIGDPSGMQPSPETIATISDPS